MALTEIYVDPSLNSDTGLGTQASPYGDLEHAIRQTTFDTTNGTRINIKAGTAEVLAASLSTALADTSVSVAWVPGLGQSLVIQGYTAAAGDGGRGAIDLTTAGSLLASGSNSYIHFVDLDITNTGAATTIAGGAGIVVDNCTIEGPASGAHRVIYCTSIRNNIMNSYIYGFGGSNQCIYLGGGSVCNCKIETSGSSYALYNNGDGVFYRNIIVVSGTGGGIQVGQNCAIIHNSIYHSAGTGTGTAIGGNNRGPICNNLIEGFAGAGGDGVVFVSTAQATNGYTGNSVYNCTNPVLNEASSVSSYANNEVLTASPFTNAAGGDFSPVDTGDVKQGSLPAAWNETAPA